MYYFSLLQSACKQNTFSPIDKTFIYALTQMTQNHCVRVQETTDAIENVLYELQPPLFFLPTDYSLTPSYRCDARFSTQSSHLSHATNF